MCIPPFYFGEGLNILPDFQKGGPWQDLNFQRGDLLQGVAAFTWLKLKSEIFNGKKVYNQNAFSVITKNLNCEILTKNLVTFNRWDGVKDEKFWYGSSLKNPIFFGGGREGRWGAERNNIFGGLNFIKRGVLDSLQI